MTGISLGRILSSIIKSADEVVQLLDPAALQANHVITICGRIDANNQIGMSLSILTLSDSQSNAMNWLRKQAESNSSVVRTLIQSMASNHKETMENFDRIKKRDVEHDRSNILSWLSTIPHLQHHKRVHEELLSGTGTWFLEDAQFTDWRDCNESAMLWIHGIPGSGKSSLM